MVIAQSGKISIRINVINGGCMTHSTMPFLDSMVEMESQSMLRNRGTKIYSLGSLWPAAHLPAVVASP